MPTLLSQLVHWRAYAGVPRTALTRHSSQAVSWTILDGRELFYRDSRRLNSSAGNHDQYIPLAKHVGCAL